MPRRKGVIFTPANVRKVSIRGTIDTSTGRQPAYYHGKIYLKSTPASPLKSVGAQRVFLKPVSLTRGLERSEKEIQIRKKLHHAGIPVPKAGVVSVMHEGKLQHFMAISPFLKKGGKVTKLVPINTQFDGRPTFFSVLDPVNDRLTIERTAVLAAKMINAGISSFNFDYLGFYRSKAGWIPVVMDTEDLVEENGLADRRAAAAHVLFSMRDVLPPHSRVFEIFERVFVKQLTKDIRADL